jgi:urea carboxylase
MENISVELYKPRYRQSGNAALLVEFGDEPSLELNFRAIALSQHIAQNTKNGITDTVISYTSLLIEYDPHLTNSSKVIQVCKEWIATSVEHDKIQLVSRLVEIPICYNDPWTRACADEYSRTIKKIEPDIEFVTRINDCRDVQDAISRHVSTNWWVGHMGFPGLPVLMPMNPQHALKTPKYNPPRMWTPAGTVALGGMFTAIYPVVVPDGYQMLGRTPLPLYNPAIQSASEYDDSLILLHIGDQVRFIPISEQQFLEIEESVAAKTYQFKRGAEQFVALAELQGKTRA